MLIGVISDTHDHLDNVKKAIKIFENAGVDLIVHCGDIIAPFCLDLFNESRIEWMGVLGNNDGEVEILLKRAEGKLTKEPKIAEIEGKKILIKHFHYFVEELAESGKYHIIFYGHTHYTDVRKINNTLVVNPGEACGWVTGRPTVAIVDTEKLEARIVDIK